MHFDEYLEQSKRNREKKVDNREWYIGNPFGKAKLVWISERIVRQQNVANTHNMPNASNVFLLTKQTSLFVCYKYEIWAAVAIAATSMGIYAWLVVWLPIHPLSGSLPLYVCVCESHPFNFLFYFPNNEMFQYEWLLLCSRFFLCIGQISELLLLFYFFTLVIQLSTYTIYSMLRFLYVSALALIFILTCSHSYIHFTLNVHFLDALRKTTFAAIAISCCSPVHSFIHSQQFNVIEWFSLEKCVSVCEYLSVYMGMSTECITWHFFGMRMSKAIFECAAVAAAAENTLFPPHFDVDLKKAFCNS